MAGMHEQLQRIAALLTEGGKGGVEQLPRPMEVWQVAKERMELEEKADDMSDEESNAIQVAQMNALFDNER